jgi:putative ABC transport system substrate-binding protein
MKRRTFIAGLGSAAAWPLAARAQQDERVRRVGVLESGDENDPLEKARISAFTQALANLGWTEGRNVRLDLRWGGGDINRIRALAQELVGLRPDIIVTNQTPPTVAVQRETRTIPIVFASVGDPVASSIVARLDRPSGNVTGFATLEASLGGKWLELLSEIAPGLKRVAIMFNPDTAPASTAFMPSLETAARSLRIMLNTAPVHSDVEIDTAVIALGGQPGDGLVVLPELFTYAHRAPIMSAAAQNNIPAVYGLSEMARDGGLLSFGTDQVDSIRRAATYVDRILRGAKALADGRDMNEIGLMCDIAQRTVAVLADHRGTRSLGSGPLDPAPVSSRWTGIAKSGTLVVERLTPELRHTARPEAGKISPWLGIPCGVSVNPTREPPLPPEDTMSMGANVGEDSAALVQGGGADAAAGAQFCYRAEPTGTDGHGHDSR